MALPPDDPPESPSGGRLTSIHIRKAIRNERESVAWLVSRFTPLLLCQAQHRIAPALRRVCDPDDAVADVWIKVLLALPTLEPSEGSFSRGLIRFASTVLIRRLRDLLEKHVVHKPPTVSAEGEGLAGLPAETRGVVSHVIAEERKGLVWAALDALSDEDREIIVLRGIEGRPHKEISLRVGLTPEHVAVRYHRILKKLREALPQSVFDELDDSEDGP
jgi:RNA polymerase sigma factor (sigma-70 family)